MEISGLTVMCDHVLRWGKQQQQSESSSSLVFKEVAENDAKAHPYSVGVLWNKTTISLLFSEVLKIMEWFRLERILKIVSFQPPAVYRDTFH